eukprot:3968413-Heterocapsa_arctica.AAC.1
MGTSHLVLEAGSDPKKVRSLLNHDQVLASMVTIRSRLWLMPRLSRIAWRCSVSMVPAFSTTVWTVMSGLQFWRMRAIVGKMKKWRELGPQ